MSVSALYNPYNNFDIFIALNNLLTDIARSIVLWFGKIGFLIVLLAISPIVLAYIIIGYFLIKKYRKVISKINYKELDYENLIKFQKLFSKSSYKVNKYPNSRFFLLKEINLLYNDVEKINKLISEQIEITYNEFFTSEEAQNEYQTIMNGVESW